MHPHPFQVELDGLADQVEGLFSRLADRDATRQVGHMGAKPVLVGSRRIAYRIAVPSGQAGLTGLSWRDVESRADRG